MPSGVTGTTAYSTSSSSGRGSGGSSGSNYHQSLPRHFLRANGNSNAPGVGGPGTAMQPSIAPSIGVGSSNRPTTTTNTNTGRLLTSSSNRGLPYSVGLSHYSQTNRTHQQQQQQQQPIRTVSYYSTLNAAQNNGSQGGRGGSGGIYPDVAHDVMQPPRQFDSYYYHPATLNHSQTSVPLYTGPYRQRQNDNNVMLPNNGPGPRGLPSKKAASGVQYNDLTSRVGPAPQQQPHSTNGRPRPNGPTANNGASTEYAILKFNPANVGKEIDV